MSLQPLETPPLRVSRPVAACSRCRNAKIKCDGKLPACTSCEKNGRAVECKSTNDQFARGKERSYVSTLETRIGKLESRLRDANLRKPSVVEEGEDDTAASSRRTSVQVQQPSQRHPQVQEPPTPIIGRRQKRKEVSAIDDLVSDFGFLSVNATARDFHGFTQYMSYSRLVLWACTKEELPKGLSKALPPRQHATELIQFYLNNVFLLLPAFEETTLYSAIDNVYAKVSHLATPLSHWMVRIICAISSASMSRRSDDQHYKESVRYASAALDFAEHVIHPGNIWGVQALVLLAEYAMLVPRHFDSWQIIGAASRAMTDLGYHQDPPKGTYMERSRLDLRRRIFYCIYVLDRSTSLVQTRAFSFSDASARVKMPFVKQLANGPASPEPQGSAQSPATNWLQPYEQAFDLIEMRQLQSAWYTDLFQTSRTPLKEPYFELWKVCDGMRKWFENISPTTTPNVRAFFELDLLYSYVYVLSPSSRVSRIHPYAQKLSFEYCIRYADLMLHVITDSSYTAPMTFYDAMRVYMTGRQFLDVMNHSVDMLLSGVVPIQPKSTHEPPPMPFVPPPPGESVQRSNINRAINCFRQIGDCMAHFGARWGYVSWHERFRAESRPMLDSLEQRLLELNDTERQRQASVWDTTTVASSNGSIAYYSPPSLVSQGSMSYQQAPPRMLSTQVSFGEPSTGSQSSPPQFSQPFEQQYPAQQAMPYSQTQPEHQGLQQQQQAINYGDASFRQSSFATAPGQQFAAWSGYGMNSGPGMVEEENADPRRRGTNQITLDWQPVERVDEDWQPARRPAEEYHTMFDPSPRSSTVLPNSSYEKMVPEHLYKGYRPSIPGTAALPDLTGTRTSVGTGTGKGKEKVIDPSMPPPPRLEPRTSMSSTTGKGKEKAVDPNMPPPPKPEGPRRVKPEHTRRVSMWDAVNDLMSSAALGSIGTWKYQTPPERTPSPRVYSPIKVRRVKGKSKLADASKHTSAFRLMGGSTCRWKAGIGDRWELLHRSRERRDGAADIFEWGGGHACAGTCCGATGRGWTDVCARGELEGEDVGEGGEILRYHNLRAVYPQPQIQAQAQAQDQPQETLQHPFQPSMLEGVPPAWTGYDFDQAANAPQLSQLGVQQMGNPWLQGHGDLSGVGPFGEGLEVVGQGQPQGQGQWVDPSAEDEDWEARRMSEGAGMLF